MPFEMSPSPLPIYSPLPPTTNILSSEQRARLVRSSRKLGSVLGSTPYLVENDKSFMLPIGKTTSRALKRQGSIFTHHQTSSLSITSISTASSHHHSSSISSFFHPQSPASPMQSSNESLPLTPPGLPTTRRCRTDGKPPPLYLRINTVPFSPKDDHVPLSLSPTSSSRPPSPITPIVPDDAEIRRKRMAKLARHLGEQVPAELVFASDSAPKRAPMSHKRRSRSVIGIHAEDTRISEKKPGQRSRQDWVGEWNRPDIRDVQKELRNLRIR